MTTAIKGNATSTFGGNIDVTGNVITDAPAFNAYLASDQTGVSSGVFTKIAFDTKEYDTTSSYNTTNYRFTPNVAGYYQINAAVGVYQPDGNCGIFIYKNGSQDKWGNYITRAGTPSLDLDVVVSTLVYFNGSTDYIEIYVYLTRSAASKFYGNSSYVSRTYFNGFLARAV